MLDQPILSFKSMNAGGTASEGASMTDSGIDPGAALEDINQTGNTEATHKFAEVLKDTQTKMRSLEPDTQGNSIEPMVSELISVDLPEAVSLSAAPLILKDIDSSILNNQFMPSLDVDTDLSINNENLDVVLIENTEIVPSGALSITAIEPIDKGVSENRLSPLMPAQAQENNKSLLQIVNPLVNEEPVLQTPKLTPSTTGVPLQGVTTQASLAGAGNKGQFLQQLDKVVVESLVEGEEPTIDADILKNLGFTAQSPMSAQPPSNNPATLNTPLTVTIPFQQSSWGNAVAEKVMWLSHQGLQEAEIQLDPPELGPLQVKISVENDQAHVSFVVQHSNVKEALEQTATRLREMFEAEGLDLVDVDVSDQSAQQENGEAFAGDDTELADTQTEQQDDVVMAAYIPSSSGIDAYA